MPSTINRRTLGLGLGAMSLAGAVPAIAQDYPAKAIRMILPLSAASTGDILARKISDGLAAELGQPLVIDNLPGAGGVPATDQIARAAKDGHLLGVVSSNHVVTPSVIPNVPYDAVRDFTWISVVGASAFVLAVPASSPVKSVKDLVDLARAKPGDVTYGSSGNGTVLHLAAVLFAGEAGVSLKHVPYKGLAPAVNDLLGGTIDMLFTAYAPIAGHVQAGKLRVLAVSTKTRDPATPTTPTLAESGLPNYEYSGWIALVGPAGLPADVVAKISAALRKTLARGETKEALDKLGIAIVGSDTAATTGFVAGDFVKQTKLAKLSGARVE